ncbi:MAG: MFS transporter [Anaerolineae bacterium]|nr:MFS transporter [Anaerolineae bacterium]
MNPLPEKSLSKPLIAFMTFSRWMLATSVRMVYPFLPVLSRGLGVTLEQISGALSVRAFAGVIMPLLGSLTDRFGRKNGMLIGLSLFIAGNSLVTFVPTFVAFTVGISISILGLMLHLTSMQAYISDAVSYEQRGRVLAFLEYGWSLSYIVAMPLVAGLIAWGGWHAPFPFLAISGVIILLLTIKFLPQGNRVAQPQGAMWRNFGSVLRSPAALAGLALGLLISASNEVVNLVFGVWMEDAFALKLGALGLASTVIGFAELGGESLTAWLVDRLGKMRAVAIGLILGSLVAIAIPFASTTLTGALASLFVFYLCFEFTMVSSLPLVSELLPEARATLMGALFASFSIGRMLGILAAPRLYEQGFIFNVIASIALNVLAFGALAVIQRHFRHRGG